MNGSARPAQTRVRPRHSSTPGTIRTLQPPPSAVPSACAYEHAKIHAQGAAVARHDFIARWQHDHARWRRCHRPSIFRSPRRHQRGNGSGQPAGGLHPRTGNEDTHHDEAAATTTKPRDPAPSIINCSCERVARAQTLGTSQRVCMRAHDRLGAGTMTSTGGCVTRASQTRERFERRPLAQRCGESTPTDLAYTRCLVVQGLSKLEPKCQRKTYISNTRAH